MLSAIIAEAFPGEEWVKIVANIGITGGMLWWVLARLIPAKDLKHAEDMKQARLDFKESLKEVVTTFHSESTRCAEDNRRVGESIAGLKASMDHNTARIDAQTQDFGHHARAVRTEIEVLTRELIRAGKFPEPKHPLPSASSD